MSLRSFWIFTKLFSADAKIISYRGRSKGFGFVTMSSEQEADSAFNTLQGSELQERQIKIEKATPQVPRDETSSAPARRGRGGRRGSRGGRRRANSATRDGPASKTVIYIGNLPYAATDEDLMAVFEEFGVVKAHVVRRADGRSKGFGFVTVESEEKQAAALAELSNVEIDNRRLYIRAAQSEESYDERQAKAATSEQAQAVEATA